MKLPHHLLRTYRRYKEEEQNLLLWIESAARESGHILTTKKAKRKGRARTLARRAGAIQQASTTEIDARHETPQQNEATISILEILPPVAAIAKNPRILSIPIEIVNQFSTVLDLRNACLRWFRGNTAQHDATTLKDNERHTFPVIVLNNAISILKSKFPPREGASSRELSSVDIVSAAIQVVDNPFAQLPSEESDGEIPQTPCENSHPVRDDFDHPLLRDSKMTNEEKLQDEFNMSKFCMLRDVQQIEDFMVLELVRYSLDQANADTLSFLSNTSIDIVSKMESLLYDNFDFAKFEMGFFKDIILPNKHVLLSSPQLRMQNVIAVVWKRRQGMFESSTFQPASTGFDPHLPYFGAPVEQQMVVEQYFLDNLLHIQEEGNLKNSAFSADLIVGFFKGLFPRGFDGNYYQVVPAYVAFGVRIALLATLILKDRRLLSLDLLSNTCSEYARSESCREKFWETHDYKSRRVAKLWFTLQPTLENQGSNYRKYENSIVSGRSLLSAHHTVCVWNHCHLRMRYASTSIAAMEISNIVKILAHLWNLLREETKDNHNWPDMDYLLSVLGEEYMFQSAKPVSVEGDPRAIRSRILYAMNFVKTDILKGLKLSNGPTFVRPKLRHKPRFNPSCYPLFNQLTMRTEGTVGALDGAVDAELIATASVVPDIIGRKSRPVLFNENNQIENKPTLWKLRDQGPGLHPIELLAVVKRGLQKELRIMDFDYLSFEEVIHGLVSAMTEGLETLKKLSSEMASTASQLEKLEIMMFHIINDPHGRLLHEVSAIFKRWLPQNGHVGVKGLRIVDQRPVNPRSQISSLRPEVFSIVETIVKRRGLREDVFSQDQLDTSSIFITERLDDTIKAAWANHSVLRKTTKLETGRHTHPDLDLL